MYWRLVKVHGHVGERIPSISSRALFVGEALLVPLTRHAYHTKEQFT